MRVRILSAAEEDLEDGFRFYESQAAGLGSYFLDSLYSDIDSLAFFAGIHQVVFGYQRQLSKRFPFAVYYRVIAKATPRRHSGLDPESSLLSGHRRPPRRSDRKDSTPPTTGHLCVSGEHHNKH